LLESDRRLVVSPESSPTLNSDAGLADLRQPLQIPGRTEIPPLGVAIEAEYCAAEEAPARGSSGECVLLDADSVGPALWVRVPRPGDRFRPLGMGGSKKLSDLFIDAKVPRRSRRLVPVIENGEHLVWVVGHRLDDRAKLTPQTRRMLRLQLLPPAGE
jgi:tRNA(Ile)-lysidine synthase